MDPTDHLLTLAAHQHGVVHRRQVRSAGLSAGAFRWQVRQRRWLPFGPGLWAAPGAPRTDEQRAMAAVLDAGGPAALSYRSAAALWGVPGFSLGDPLEVSRPRSGAGSSHIADVVHLPRHWPERHRTLVRALPLTTPARTVVDLAGVVHPLRLERVLDHLWARRLVTHGSLSAVVDELGGRGRSGTRAVRALLADRGEHHRPPESGLESRFDRILTDGGERPFERQVVVGDADGPIGRLDHADLELRIAVEIDSDLHHTSISDRRRDAERDRRLRSAGWIVLRFTEFEIWHRPDAVLAAVRDARRARRPAA